MMLRGRAILLALALLAAAMALPLAEAEKKRKQGGDLLTPIPAPGRAARDAGEDPDGSDGHDGQEPDEDDPPETRDEDDLRQAAAGGKATGMLTVGALLALLLLTLALAGIWWARRPSMRAPPKRTFEAGRSRAHAKRPTTPQEAFEAFGSAHMGSVVSAAPVVDGYEVRVARKKGQPCHQTAGFLAGLFESAWADAVRVEHPVCAGEGGGECRYTVRRGAAFSGSGRPTGEASTPGSGGAPRRSPQARRGGG